MKNAFLWRRFVHVVMTGATLAAAIVTLVPLALILSHLVARGFAALDVGFFLRTPAAVGVPGGGIANAIAGSALLILLACAVGLPVGVLGGIWLAEFGSRRAASVVRFAADMLAGTPSIAVGVVVYLLVVVPMRGFSALSGGIALGIIMIPLVLRTTEEMLKLVPRGLAEGALALGIPAWKALVHVVLRTARPGIVTGILIAIARVAGETAPLLFTALGSPFVSWRLSEPVAAMPLTIFQYAISPFETWQQQAWAGALLLIALVLTLNLAARALLRERLQARR